MTAPKVERKTAKTHRYPSLFLWIGLGLSVLFLIIESLVHTIILKEGTLFNQIFHPQPHEIWTRLLVASLLIISGAYAQTIINQRKRAEEALQAASERNESIINSSPFGISIYDSSGDCIVSNDALANMIGASKEQVLQQNYHQIESWKKSGLYDIALSAMAEKVTKRHEIEVKTTSEKTGSFACHMVPMSFANESHLLFIIDDITDRKRAEEDKERLEEQLRQSQKMESIGTLSGGIAHDFNNVLGIIVGNTDLAMHDIPEWTPARYNLEEVRKASLRARELVKQILSFSRQTKPELKPIQICSIIEESLKLLRSSIPTTIEIKQVLSSHTDTILGDSTQINQIFMNLCTNAAHAMLEKGGVLEVKLSNIDLNEQEATRYYDLSAGKYLTLLVSDTGHGMAPEITNRIFDPYFTTKRSNEGTGMGLAVVHRIVKNHNGTILVTSEPGKGTTFTVFLPLIESETVRESTSHEPLPTGTERILFVDDEEALAATGKRMLQYLGYEVTTKTSSIEALEIFKTQPDKFDLVITDMTMPNMTGENLCKELLRLRLDLPIILCTGFSEIITEEQAKRMGIKAFLMKPLGMREIAKTIRRMFDQTEEDNAISLH